MRIKSVTIEGMHNVVRKTYDLSNLTYLYGPNGVGKSTVMQSIQLALLGYIPGTAKTKSEIFKHSNNHTMAVSLVIDDNGSDVSIRRIWTGSGSTITTTIDINPNGYNIEKLVSELELPIFNFNEFMDMTANKLKDWFVEFLPSSDTDIDWNSTLTDDLSKSGATEITEHISNIINESVDEIKTYNLSGVDEIRKANEYFKSMLSFKKKELERVQSTVQSLVFYDDIDISVDEDTVRNYISDYQTKMRDRALRIDAAKRYDLMKTQLDGYSDCTASSYKDDARVVESVEKISKNESLRTELEEKYRELQKTSSEYSKNISNERAEITSINGKISVLQGIIDGGGICPFTSTKCDSVQSLIEKYKEDIKSYKSEITTHEEKITALKQESQDIAEASSGILDELKNLDIAILQSRQDIVDIKGRYETFSKLNSNLGEPPVSEVDDTDYIALIAEQQDLLVKIGANKKYNELIDTLTSDKYTIENEIIAYKSWINLTGVNGLQSDDSVTKPFVDLASQMDTYIQTVFGNSVNSKFNIESKANSFSFGIERNGKYIPFNLLSSGEKCMYTLSLMLSLVSKSKSQIKLVMVDDLFDHLDSVNTKKLFTQLKSVKDIQMIFAGVKEVNMGDFVVEIN